MGNLCAELNIWMIIKLHKQKITQAFDASHSVCRRSSGLVCDKRQLPKILAPKACGNIQLLILLVFFRLVREEKRTQ